MVEQRRNLRKYIIPAMVSNLSFFILTVVDGMFVGQGVGPNALGAVSIAMPFVNMIWALSTLFNIGGVAVASVRFGRGDTAGANQTFMHALSASLLLFSLVSLTGMLFSEEIAVLLGANDTYREMVSDYVFWYSVFLLPTTTGPCLNTFARNDGNPSLSLAMSFTCTAANIFGDWLMVYPLQKGVAGAAIATGVANSLGLLVVLSHYVFKKGKLRIRGFKPQISLYGKIMLRGVPEMVSQFANPITTFSMNNILINHLGDPAVNAYSVITYAGSLFSSLMWGLSGGLQPLYGLSYGAKDDRSLKYYFRSGRIMALIGGVGIFLLTFFVSKPLCQFFGADAVSVPIVCSALPKYCLNYVFAASTAVIAAYLFSTKRTQYAIPINVCRSIVFNFACINFLPLLFGYDFVWYAISVAEGLCMVIALVLRKLSERKGIVYK
ncbi:MAG: MATE family efflux transporter [Oscillospiraceae bacterium]|nr:MATE family efflux transporter [Oscillospiraceae bacterium]